MIFLYVFTFAVFLFSLLKDREKTLMALKSGGSKFVKILPQLIMMIILISVSLTFVSDKLLVEFFSGKNMLSGFLLASFAGSISLMPGYIVFPLCGMLLTKGVSYTIISVFTTTLMMVGIVTYPLEAKYFGKRFTIVRNLVSYIIAVIIAIFIGIMYGELL
jgi:uncharacterized membrane protein YraQ (UPF0718 family)